MQRQGITRSRAAAHAFNPPHLPPLVEIVPGRQTAPDVVVAALWREAVYLVERGVCDLDDVDRAIVAGPGPRWTVLGQGLSYHLGGGAGGLARFLETFDAPVRSRWNDLGAPVYDAASKRNLVAGAEALEASVGGRDVLIRRRNEALQAVLRAPGPFSVRAGAERRGQNESHSATQTALLNEWAYPSCQPTAARRSPAAGMLLAIVSLLPAACRAMR